MPSRSTRTRPLTVLLLASVAVVATACSAPTSTVRTPANDASVDAGVFPVSITNCGTALTLPEAPRRVFLIGPDSIPVLDAVGALDRVMGITGALPTGVYGPDLQRKVDALTKVTSGTGSTGGSVISSEVVIAQDPDLVIGPTTSVDRDALSAAGIPLYVPPSYCDDPSTSSQSGTASFDWVEDQVSEYGTMFGVPAEAAAANQEIASQLSRLPGASGSDAPAPSAVALYVPEGGGTVYPYGAPSMVTPLFTTAGLTNVYGDRDERVFEANLEDLLDRDPDVVVLLYSAGDDAGVRRSFGQIGALKSLSAVKDDHVVTLPFPYTDPPTPLTVTGAEVLATQVAGHR